MLPRILPATALALMLATLAAHADLMAPTVREPQYPLKTQRMLLSDACS